MALHDCSSMIISMNRLSTRRRMKLVRTQVESNSVRSTSRMTGAAMNTVLKLLVDLGRACSDYQAGAFHDLACHRVQRGEVRAFCYSKQKNVPEGHRGEYDYGDLWTFTIFCGDCKLVPAWLVILRRCLFRSSSSDHLRASKSADQCCCRGRLAVSLYLPEVAQDGKAWVGRARRSSQPSL